jgi:hypothetical protein
MAQEFRNVIREVAGVEQGPVPESSFRYLLQRGGELLAEFRVTLDERRRSGLPLH